MAERPWQVDAAGYRLGLGGIDLRHVADAIPETRYPRLKNAIRVIAGGVTGRPGQTQVATAAGVAADVHSLTRLEDPANATFTRLAGIDTGLWAGQTTLVLLQTEFSGEPLGFVAYRPPLSSETWMYVADSAQMRKVRRDGLVLPVGLPAPGTACDVADGDLRETLIDAFESGWTAYTETAIATSLTTVAGVSGNAQELVTTGNGVQAGFTWMDKSIGGTLNLARVGTGGDAVDATDDDLMHLYIWVDNPAVLSEVRLYLVSGSFTAGDSVPPGMSGGVNVDGYVTSILPATVATQLEPDVVAPDVTLTPLTAATVRLAPGPGVYTEFGVVGRPLRRSDFQVFGNGDWSDIQGLVLVVSLIDKDAAVITTFDAWSLRGGSPVDSTESEASPYDWRYTDYDPRTGTESNGSPIMVTAQHGTRQRKVATPLANTDPVLLQRFYRRGGTLPDDWWYVGINTANGGAFVDETSDAAAEGSGLRLPDDHDQPVTTTAANGDVVRNVPLSALWGPVAGLFLMGCGDPYRPGHLYWSRPGEPDHWSPFNNKEVCSPSEQLLNGLVYSAQSFVFSSERLYAAVLQPEGAASQFEALPTPCGRGLAGKWAFCVGPEIYFVARDGIYATDGGVEKLLSADIDPLFKRVSAPRDILASTTLGGYGEGGYGEGGYGQLNNSAITSPPGIDWRVEASSALRLVLHENELWFTYLDITGRIQTLIYSLLDDEWRWDLYARPPRSLYSEQYGRVSRLLFGSVNGRIYERSGSSDDGDAIDGLVRTGVRLQGAPRADKLYGDLATEIDTRGVAVSVRSYLGPEETFLTATHLVNGVTGTTVGVAEVEAGHGRQQTRHPHFANGVHARGLSLEFAWLTHEPPPILYGAEVSYLVDPDRMETRPTDWTDCGVAGLKLVNAVIVEIDTGGVPKELVVEGDGQVQTTLTVTTSTRQQLELPLSFEARLVRVRPIGTEDILLYGLEWVVDPLPLSLALWQSRALDLGQFGWFTHFDSYVMLRSSVEVTFTLTLDGVPTTYTIPSTNGLTSKVYVPFHARKCRLAEYRLEGATPFLVFREETFVRIVPWGGPEFVEVHPFGGAPQNPPARSNTDGVVPASV